MISGPSLVHSQLLLAVETTVLQGASVNVLKKVVHIYICYDQEVTGPPAAAEHLAREKVDGQNLNFNVLQFKNVIKIFGT